MGGERSRGTEGCGRRPASDPSLPHPRHLLPLAYWAQRPTLMLSVPLAPERSRVVSATACKASRGAPASLLEVLDCRCWCTCCGPGRTRFSMPGGAGSICQSAQRSPLAHGQSLT